MAEDDEKHGTKPKSMEQMLCRVSIKTIRKEPKNHKMCGENSEKQLVCYGLLSVIFSPVRLKGTGANGVEKLSSESGKLSLIREYDCMKLLDRPHSRIAVMLKNGGVLANHFRG